MRMRSMVGLLGVGMVLGVAAPAAHALDEARYTQAREMISKSIAYLRT